VPPLPFSIQLFCSSLENLIPRAGVRVVILVNQAGGVFDFCVFVNAHFRVLATLLVELPKRLRLPAHPGCLIFQRLGYIGIVCHAGPATVSANSAPAVELTATWLFFVQGVIAGRVCVFQLRKHLIAFRLL